MVDFGNIAKISTFFSKFFFISRNMRCTDFQPWGLKVPKGTKEPFSKLRINIEVVYGTWWILQISRIIANNRAFLAYLVFPPVRIIRYLDRQGKTLLNFVRYLLVFLASNYLSNSQSYVIMKFTTIV